MTPVVKLSFPSTREFWEIPVLFEDEHLLALDKPGGLLSSPDGEAPDRPSLIALLHAGIAEMKPWAKTRGLSYLMNAHRLDGEISGVLLLAKSKPVLVALTDSFGSEQPHQKYVALAQGTPQAERFEVEARLAPHPIQPGLMRVDHQGGKRAHSSFVVLEKFMGWTLLKANSATSRIHQIRVHLKHLGLPIVGDSLYGGKPLWLSRLKPTYRLKPGQVERPLISRVALHAEELRLPHPVLGTPLTIAAPWPKDLRVALKYLQKYASAR